MIVHCASLWAELVLLQDPWARWVPRARLDLPAPRARPDLRAWRAARAPQDQVRSAAGKEKEGHGMGSDGMRAGVCGEAKRGVLERGGGRRRG